jgi:Sulfotransferase domain
MAVGPCSVRVRTGRERMRQSRAMTGHSLVFVGGIGRSGSTLIERLLGELPGVCSVGEIVHLWRRNLVDDERCGCGVAFSACGFWRQVGERAFGGWDTVDAAEVLAVKASVDRTRHVPALLRRSSAGALSGRIAAYADLYHRLHAAIAEVSGCPVVVDASKHGSLAACLHHRYGSSMRVVHVVRDPRAVAYSWSKHIRRPEATATSPEQTMARYSASRASVQWTAQNAIFGALARHGVDTLRVRYEDFAAAPDKEFRRVAEFVGHRGTIDFRADQLIPQSTSHAVSGNPMRFATGPVDVRPDEAWRHGLGTSHRLLVSALTAGVRRRYGY